MTDNYRPAPISDNITNRQFTIVNRDFYPIQQTLDLNQECQVELRGSTAFERRAEPIFFAIDNEVVDPVEEYRIRFEISAETRLGASFLVSMPGGSVLTDGFFTADRNGNLLSDSFRAYGMVARYGFNDLGDRKLEQNIAKRRPVSGSALVLGIQTNSNYFHWLMEALPRLWLARQAPELSVVSVLTPNLTPWMADMVGACGIAQHQHLVCPTNDMAWEHLVVPSRGLWNINTFTWHAFALIDELREKIEARAGSRRLFVSRQRAASRRIHNEDEIFSIAERYGFERIFPEELSFVEQVSLFAGAEAVAGALGAGLTNAVFMAPGGTLLEFAPEQRQGDATLFANLAHHRKLHYAGVVGLHESDKHRPFDRRDFRVPYQMAAGAFATIF